MKEILLAFILALIIGSIINGWQQQPPQEAQRKPIAGTTGNSTKTSENTGSTGKVVGADFVPPAPAPTGPRRDFPDFNSFPSLDSANFNDLVLASEKPVFIVCFTPNNLSCERMIPLIAALAQEHADSIKMTKLNVLGNAGLAQKYEVYSVPTFIAFSKGQITARLTGVVAKDRLEEMVKVANQSR